MKTTTQREPRVNAEHEVEYLTPEVNIFESKDGYVLEAEMPGVNKDGLEITLEDNQMTLLGRRHVDSMPGEVVFRESRDAAYKRVFALDPAIDTGKITARMDQGVLTLTLPKSERVKPRKITVT
jgi:HSP20 family protein